MLGVLLESRARRPRRSGGAALSVSTHLAIVAAVSVASARGARPAHALEKPVFVHIALPTREPERRPEAATPHAASLVAPPRGLPTIVAPVVVPTELPAVELGRGVSIDSLLAGPIGRGGVRPTGMIDSSDDSPHSGEWTGSELLMRITRSAKPRYPEVLRQAGIDGRVLVRFTVDTLGAIDLSSVQIVSSTHEQFSRAVREILPAFRFKPSEVGGRRVRSLAEMPFEFSVVR